MKRLYTSILSLIFVAQLFAGGIVTNSNQSIQYLRMLARSASGEIDAVYYNPAGIMRMEDGFHVYASNMSLFQTRTVTATSPFHIPNPINGATDVPITLNQTEYLGKVNAYLYPNVYAVYKKEKWALALGFGPNGGGGSAEFKDGLPMFERPVATLPTVLSGSEIPTTAYDLDAYFKGSSVFLGTQINFTYKINDMLSLGAGVRLINAVNTYEGHLRNIRTNPDLSLHPLGASLPQYTGDMISTSDFFNNMSTVLTGIAASAYGAGASMNDLISGGAGDLTFAQAEAGVPGFDATARAQLEGGLLGFGIPQAQIDAMTLSQAQATYNGFGDGYTASAAEAAANSEATGDIEVDVKQTGMAFTPIFSANITPIEGLNIAIKYELNTNLELTNDTKEDGSGLFTHDSTFRSDIPAVLALGIQYDFNDKLSAQISHVTYFDKGADWGGKEEYIDKNLFELAFGVEYKINDKLLISGGYSLGQAGPTAEYQSELSYTNSSHTVGLGVQYQATEQLTLNLGGMNTIYTDYTSEDQIDKDGFRYTNTYGKRSMGIGIGATYKF